jgi:hypothetical protein
MKGGGGQIKIWGKKIMQDILQSAVNAEYKN